MEPRNHSFKGAMYFAPGGKSHLKSGTSTLSRVRAARFCLIIVAFVICITVGLILLTQSTFSPFTFTSSVTRDSRKQAYCKCPKCRKSSISSGIPLLLKSDDKNTLKATEEVKKEPFRRTPSTEPECPLWFKYIKEDLKPWSSRGGITEESVLSATLRASFHAKIVGGELYVETFAWCFQTRSVFTIWGIAQLLKRFPGQVPDVDFMFQCEDFPSVHAPAYGQTSHPPLLLKYCRPDEFLDVLWPDWTFWGWAELKMDEWEPLRDRIVGDTGSIPYEERDTFAFWKGVTGVAPEIRGELVKCDDEPNHKWGIVAKETDWVKELDSDETKLEKQCNHRYKVYCEGRSWSVSLKYILACGSTPILIHPFHTDFFSRGLVNGVHYLEVPHPREGNVCENIHNIVSNGTKDVEGMKAIGLAAQKYVKEDLSMARVYDYMLLFLQEYASLQLFEPKVDPKSNFEHATEKWIIDHAPEYSRAYLKMSNETSIGPCSLPL